MVIRVLYNPKCAFNTRKCVTCTETVGILFSFGVPPLDSYVMAICEESAGYLAFPNTSDN